jgi:Tol biopolymer transport system component
MIQGALACVLEYRDVYGNTYRSRRNGSGRPLWKRPAWESWTCGDWEIWAMNADGSGATNLTDNPAGDWYPSWSPDEP